MNNNFQKSVVLLLLLIACIIFPFLLIIVIPMGIYYFGKKQYNKSEIDDLIESQLLNKTPVEIENFRIYMLDLSQNFNATEVERDNAKYALNYLNKRNLKG
jgi:hypothetical protein